MNKIVQNHIEKLFLTSDAATMIRELDIKHPAAKMVVMAAHQQEEAGDGTNGVVILWSAILTEAEYLLRMGLSVPEVVSGLWHSCLMMSHWDIWVSKWFLFYILVQHNSNITMNDIINLLFQVMDS